MKINNCLCIGFALAIILTSCQSATQKPSGTNTPVVTSPATGATSTTAAGSSATAASTTAPASTPAASPAPANNTAIPAAGGMPPQTTAAEIRPADRRPELTRLTNLLHFQVTGFDKSNLGQIADFVINTCETYIIYMAVDPAPELKIASGQRLVIPFEAVTINSGVIDAAAKSISLSLAPSRLSAAPASPASLPLFPNSWEQPVRDYWQRVVRVGKLSTACAAGGGAPIYKTAYATQLLGAQLKDGNGALLGAVSEAILEPESGKLGFYVVNLQNNQGLILLPLAKTNIPDNALKPGAKIELVLLADSKQIPGAPRLANADSATDANAQSAARQYWGH